MYASNEEMNQTNVEMKRELVQLVKANGCLFCGSMNKLTFHHTDPKTKRNNISSMLTKAYKFSAFMSEMSKCICICDHCHNIVHGFKLLKKKNMVGYMPYFTGKAGKPVAVTEMELKKKFAMNELKETFGVYKTYPIRKKSGLQVDTSPV